MAADGVTDLANMPTLRCPFHPDTAMVGVGLAYCPKCWNDPVEDEGNDDAD